MNRCVRPDRKPAFPCGALAALGAAGLTIALAMLAAPAHAGLRMFPMNTERGEITFTNPPQVQLNGKTEQLGPGTRVHDAQNNRLVFANTLKGQSFTVNYVRDGIGGIREIWILTPDETRDKLPPTQAELNRIRQSQTMAPSSQPN